MARGLGRAAAAVAVLLGLLTLAGCATRLPPTEPLVSAEWLEAETLFAGFAARPTPPAIDADLRLNWDFLGSKGGVAAVLQLQRLVQLRFTATDPLGRALFLAVSDGTAFTLVDNRQSRVYQGSTDSKFWHRYVPDAVAAEDLFLLLGGMSPEGVRRVNASARDKGGAGFWYVLDARNGLTRHLLIDRHSGRIRRHLLVDDGETVLDIVYSGSTGADGAGYELPRELRVTGSAITGTLTVHIDTVYGFQPLPAATFHLVAPPHFMVEQVE
jgi:hypothetical protein